jgi:geranylgeranyl pyrophosphate synthase
VKENSNRKARRLDITEGIYYEIIRKKTATLIAACCALGAQSVIDDELQVENMRLVNSSEWRFKIKTICLIILMKR